MLSCFSRVLLFAVLWTAALQAPLSLGTLQSRILEWVAMPSSRGSSQPRDQTHSSYISCTGREVLYHQHCLGSPLVVIIDHSFWPASSQRKDIQVSKLILFFCSLVPLEIELHTSQSCSQTTISLEEGRTSKFSKCHLVAPADIHNPLMARGCRWSSGRKRLSEACVGLCGQ